LNLLGKVLPQERLLEKLGTNPIKEKLVLRKIQLNSKHNRTIAKAQSMGCNKNKKRNNQKKGGQKVHRRLK
jgi:hypothetical protein